MRGVRTNPAGSGEQGRHRSRPRGRAAILVAAAAAALAATGAHAACRATAPGHEADVVSLANKLPIRGSGRVEIGGNVTDLVEFVNGTTCSVRILKRDPKLLEHSQEAIDLEPQASHRGSMWVPWADSWDAPNALWIHIEGQPAFVIWQRGDRLRFLTARTWETARRDHRLAEAFSRAPEVPGLAAQGGRRSLYVGWNRSRPFFLIRGYVR